jgi:thioredoxin 1
MEEWSESYLKERIASTEKAIIYFYTPLCGTCKVSEKMLTIIEEILPQHTIGKSNINYIPLTAKVWMIESVPCLLIFTKGKITKRIYAFHDVPYLYNQLKGV